MTNLKPNKYYYIKHKYPERTIDRKLEKGWAGSCSYDVFAQNILTLFNKAGRNLTIDEITVGYYRQFNVIKTKRQIMGKLYNMARAREAKIKSISQLKGVYGVVK